MTLRLAATARGHWDLIEGFAASQNMPPLEKLDLTRFTSFVMWMFTKNLDDKEYQKFRSRLWRPPPGVTEVPAESPWSAQSELNALQAFKAGK